MRTRPPWLVHRRTLICTVGAIGLLSGLTIILAQGRSESALMSALFIVAIVAVLVLVLQAITILAQRSMHLNSTNSSERDDDDNHNINTSSNL